MRILVVEDDTDISAALKAQLVKAGYVVDLADNGVDGEFMGREISYDAVVLDLGLPQRSGIEVLKNWRSSAIKIPVIILTARDAWHERVDGFKAGADDYLGKPFHTEELIVRITALIRRTHQEAGGLLTKSGLVLDENRQAVTTAQGVTTRLTGTEFRLLRLFMLNPGKVLTKSKITEHVYDGDSDKDSNVIEVYVKRLRNILGESYIQTRRGQGYVFNEAQQ